MSSGAALLHLQSGAGRRGLRTVTGIAAGGSGMSLRRALPPLAIGASVFLQLHLVLGYFLGPAARDALDNAKGPAIALFAALFAALLVGAVAYWLVRRGRRRGGTQGMTEAACPLCLALNWVVERELTDRRASSPRPARAGG